MKKKKKKRGWGGAKNSFGDFSKNTLFSQKFDDLKRFLVKVPFKKYIFLYTLPY